MSAEVKRNNEHVDRSSTLAIWRAYLLFAILQAITALIILLQIGSEKRAALLLGLSPVRFAFFIVLIGRLHIPTGDDPRHLEI